MPPKPLAQANAAQAAAPKPVPAAVAERMAEESPSPEPMPEMIAIPVTGAPEPMALTPKKEPITLITSHFALPVGGDGTTLTMDLVNALFGGSAETDSRPEPPPPGGVTIEMEGKKPSAHAKFTQLMQSMQIGQPTLLDFDNAIRLLAKTEHHKMAKKLQANLRKTMGVGARRGRGRPSRRARHAREGRAAGVHRAGLLP